MDGVKCEVCGGAQFSLLFDKGRGGEQLFNNICENCGFIFVLPRPTPATLDEFYENDNFRKAYPAPSAQQIRENERGHLIRFTLLKKITQELCIDLQGSSCDIGCGLGFLVKLCNDSGFDAIGLDPGEKWTDYGRKRYGIEVKHSSLEKYEGKEKFNLITCIQVLEHVINPVDFLKKMRSRLADNGLLFLDVPGIDDRYAAIEDFFWEPHINTFSKVSLQRALTEAGFRPLWIGYSSLKFLTVLAVKTSELFIPKNAAHEILKLKTLVDAGDNVIGFENQLNDIKTLAGNLKRGGANIVAINIPFDHYAKRYGYREPEIFKNIADNIFKLLEEGLIPILYCIENRSDSQTALWLFKFGIELPIVYLQNMPADKMIEWFRGVKYCLTTNEKFLKLCDALQIPALELNDKKAEEKV